VLILHFTFLTLIRACAPARVSGAAPQTDDNVPEGHASLHAALYGQKGAEAHVVDEKPAYTIRKVHAYQDQPWPLDAFNGLCLCLPALVLTLFFFDHVQTLK